MKLALDQECQRIAEEVITGQFPQHEILGEEGTTSADGGRKAGGGERLRWIIDPIDGTVNFSHGMRRWCCSIALQQGDQTVAAAVHAPELDETYTATLDGPALLNGAPIAVSDVATVSEAIVMTGLDKDGPRNLPPLALFTQMALNAQKTRVMGCAAVDLCQVACGRVDGYFESGIYLWDIAAAGLVVTRAGGRTEQLSDFGGHRMEYMATNGRIHEELKALLSIG